MAESNQQNIRALVASGDRVTPIFRKTGTIMLGADAFSRAEDIEEAVYHELPSLLEQLETLRVAAQNVYDLHRQPFSETWKNLHSVSKVPAWITDVSPEQAYLAGFDDGLDSLEDRGGGVVSAEKIYHAFGVPPWVMEDGWTFRRRMFWRVRHPRRWWRVRQANSQ